MKRKPILVVDDDPSMRMALSESLVSCGHAVETANDGIDALETYAKLKGEFTCILLDLTMPRMSGEEAFEQLRRIAPDMPIILSSGYSEAEVATRFEGRRVSGFIQKPYRFSELRQVLRKAIESV